MGTLVLLAWAVFTRVGGSSIAAFIAARYQAQPALLAIREGVRIAAIGAMAAVACMFLCTLLLGIAPRRLPQKWVAALVLLICATHLIIESRFLWQTGPRTIFNVPPAVLAGAALTLDRPTEQNILLTIFSVACVCIRAHTTFGSSITHPACAPALCFRYLLAP